MMKFFPARILACIAWLLAAAAGFAIIINYESRAGGTGETPQQWPAQKLIDLDSHRDTLVMFAHPQCPCTSASMEELNQLLAQSGKKVAAHVVFFRPENFPTNWTHAGLWKTALTIPGLAIHEDMDGATAKKFGAETSGFVVLYNAQGQLLFHGGITSGRGHIGDNPGESAVAAMLDGHDSFVKQTLVYGCSLTGESCQSCEMTSAQTATK
jgi:hypothetical protein